MRGRLGPVLVLLLLACTQVDWPVRGQELDDPRSLLDAYASIAERYRQGRAEAVSELLALGPVRLKTLNDLMARAVRRPGSLVSSSTWTWTPALLRAAGMLHTEIAVQQYRDTDQSGFDEHIDSADRLLLLAEHGDTGSDFRPRWHLAVGLQLFGAIDIDKARFFLTRACTTFPGHGRLRLACGMSLTTYAGMIRPTPEDISRWHFSASQATSRQLEEQRRAAMAQTELENDALAHFNAARSADPSLIESALRAAYIFIGRGNDRDAERLLAPLATLNQPPALAYLARLMLGRVRERQGQLDAAATLYREAMTVLPEGTRARVALANLRHGTGERAASREIIEQLVKPRLVPPDDPWVTYTIEFVATTHAALDDLRREVRK